MKQILLILLVTFVVFSTSAQKNLHIAPLFSGEYDRNEKAVVVIVKGKTLEPYHLNLFHSISVNNSEPDVARFEKAVLNDARYASDSQIMKAGNQSMACYYELPPEQGTPEGDNRFILFKKNSKNSAILIYLEGKTGLDDLVKRFIKPANEQKK